jgi:hypothetical protein
MPLAIVLINAEVGSEDELLRELRKLDNVSEAEDLPMYIAGIGSKSSLY